MIGIIPYSKLLSAAAIELDAAKLLYNTNINETEFVLETFDSIIGTILTNNRYKFLSINIVRNGLPCFHWTRPLNSIENVDIIPYKLDNKFIEHNEFKLWNKLRSTYDKELNFIYIKNLYEDDIIRYFKQYSYIENLLDEQSSVILDNTNKTELNYPFNISMLDAIIHEI